MFEPGVAGGRVVDAVHVAAGTACGPWSWRGAALELKSIESEMVEAIRAVSIRRSPPVIGPDCMSVAILPGSPPRVEIRYCPLVEARAQFALSDASDKALVPAAYSPFVVASDIVGYPSIIVGQGGYQIGGFEVTLHAPELPPGSSIRAAMGTNPDRLYDRAAAPVVSIAYGDNAARVQKADRYRKRRFRMS